MDPTSSQDVMAMMADALEAQELASAIQKERRTPPPNDPRYTPFIGKWNGYHAPEQRWQEFMVRRKELRRQALHFYNKGGFR